MTSTLNLQTSSAIHAQRLAKSAQNPASDAERAGVSGEFSSMFSALMNGTPGQQVADMEGKASPPANLAAEALSPAVNIITTANPVTNNDSLFAFARAQGLDDSAMALIFNAESATTEKSLALHSGVVAPNLAFSPSMLSPDIQGAPISNGMALPALAELDPEATLSWSLGKVGLVDGQLAGDGLKPVLFGLNGIRNGLSMATKPGTEVNATDTTSGDIEPQNLAATLMLGAAEAAQWSKRLQLRAAGLRADNLTQGFAALSSKSPLTDAVTEASAPLETLVIGQEISGEDLPAIWAQRLGGDGQPDPSSGSSTGEATHAEQALRSEQYEKLAQRLGEALGQRLAAQIARGEWKVELALNPHKLGKIDIQLDMRRGELEASFKTSNPMTRELLIDGMPRLKEVLAQAGMEVASTNVNAGPDRQNGGNPTPGRQQQSGSAGSGINGKVTNNVASGPVATSKQTGNDDGLDVRV